MGSSPTQPTAIARVLFRFIYFALLALLFWNAARLRFHLPGWPITTADSWGYFSPAISKFAGGRFQHSHGRNFIYPGFLFLVLTLTKKITAITFAQHLLGLGTGALMLGCWAKLQPFLSAIPRAIHSLGGLAVAAIYLLTSRPVQYEHYLQPEAITPFFATLNIFLTLLFFHARWRKPPSRRAAIIAAVLLANSISLAVLKTSFVLAVLFSVVPILIALADRRETSTRRIAVLAAGVLAISLFGIPESLLAKSDPMTREFLPISLFSIHANLIAAQMDQDLTGGDCGALGCDLLGQISIALRDDMQRGWQLSKGYRSFGFDPDYLKSEPSSMETWPARFFAGNREKMLAFCMHYYWRVWLHRPGAMLRKIATQTALFYNPRNPSFSRRTTVHMSLLYEDAAVNLAGAGIGTPDERLMDDFRRASKELSDTPAVVRPPVLVQLANWILSYLYLPVLLAVVFVAIAAIFSPGLRTRHGTFLLIVLFLFSYNFGTVLGTAVMHSLHILRYSETQYAFSLLAVCAGILLFGDWAFRIFRDSLGVIWPSVAFEKKECTSRDAGQRYKTYEQI